MPNMRRMARRTARRTTNRTIAANEAQQHNTEQAAPQESNGAVEAYLDKLEIALADGILQDAEKKLLKDEYMNCLATGVNRSDFDADIEDVLSNLDDA
jgi:hypothetical protein